MKLYDFLKNILRAVMTFSAIQQTMGQTLESHEVFDIHCPRRSLEGMEADNWETGELTSDFLKSYGMQSENDTAIIGNSEWTLTPYSYSDEEKTDIIRDGDYYMGSGSGSDSTACLFFEENAFDRSLPYEYFSYPKKMECYYFFARDESYKAREGIDKFSLSTKLKAPVFGSDVHTRTMSANAGQCVNYCIITGSSAYDTNPTLCGGMFRIPYMERVGACSGQFGALTKRCDLMSSSTSIPDEKLIEMNMTHLICPKEKKTEKEEKEKQLDEKDSNCDSAIISKFFNKTQKCECNCNCNVNVQLNTTEMLNEEKNNGKEKKNKKHFPSCSIL